MAKTLEDYYRIYVNARARAWNVHDRLVAQGQFSKTNELYLKAMRVERRAWQAYLEAREG